MQHSHRYMGILPLDKPPGITSRRVVDQVQRLAGSAKVGHAGTLDPLARGLLIVCVGAATRLIEYVQRMPKRYTATFLLGRRSASEDVETDVELLDNPPEPGLEELRQAAARFEGRIEQRPSAFSAVKVRGRRAYDLARLGQATDLAARTIEVHRIELVRYDYPELVLDVRCGKGTYIRALGRDLAESLGTAAVMSQLTRTAIGRFDLQDACRAEELSAATLSERLLPARLAVADLPSVQLTADEAARIANGLAIERTIDDHAGEIAALDESGSLIGILKSRGAGQLGPSINLRLATS